MNEIDGIGIEATLFWMLVFGIITALIANRKGFDPVGYFIFGALLFIVALPVVLIRGKNQNVLDQRRMKERNEKKCHQCGSFVPSTASSCVHCGSRLNSSDFIDMSNRRNERTPIASQDELIVLLEKLQKLRDSGVLTDEEFSTEKLKLLNKI